MNVITFPEWWMKFIEACIEWNTPINMEEPNSYRPYFEDGMTPEEAAEEEYFSFD